MNIQPLRLICVSALLCLFSTSHAGRLVDVSVLDRDSGERLPVYSHAGKYYVAGTPGNRYGIELHNKRADRVLTVISVDGVNVLSGQTANTQQTGYVLDGRHRYTINGWRKNLNEVAQFVFTALPQSYAARTGRPDNVGVIGVAVHREKFVPPPVAPSPQISNMASRKEAGAAADSARLAGAPQKAEQLGTGHGQREFSPTSTTEFVRRSDKPDEVITIYYDSRQNLIAQGIIPAKRPTPKPFPAEPGFVPDPQ